MVTAADEVHRDVACGRHARYHVVALFRHATRRWPIGLLAFGWLSAGIPSASAQPRDPVLAESLFEAGRELMAAGRYDEACPKLAESHRLDPAGGTLLNLARCHELQGRQATAWAEYKDALGAARRDGRPDREQEASTRIAAIEPMLCRMRIEAGAASAVLGFELRRDGVVLGHAAWGDATPVDAGTHRIDVRAPGRRSWQRSVEVREPGAVVVVRIPELEPIRAPSVSPEGEQAHSTPGARANRDEQGMSGARVAGWTALGVGSAGLVAGGIFGFRALDRQADADRICRGDACTPEQSRGVELNEQARRDATVSNIALGVGVVAAGAGIVLLLWDDSGSSGHDLAWHTERGGGTVRWRGRW